MVLKILYKLALGFFSFYALMWLIEILVRWRLREQSLIVMLVVWLVPLISLEVIWLWHKQKPLPRFLTHLRYAPISVLFSFIVITFSFDAAMVQYSKYQIRSYVYGNTPPEQEFSLDLHNTDRGFCGNGHSATEYWLYAETAAEGFSSSDPKVRARSLRMSLQTYDWLNGVEKDSPFPKLIRQAAQDEDPLVRQMAMGFLKDRKGF